MLLGFLRCHAAAAKDLPTVLAQRLAPLPTAQSLGCWVELQNGTLAIYQYDPIGAGINDGLSLLPFQCQCSNGRAQVETHSIKCSRQLSQLIAAPNLRLNFEVAGRHGFGRVEQGGER